MANKTYVFGYGGQRYDADAIHQVEGFRQVHPEMRRRILAMIDACPHDLQIGSGWRSLKSQKDLFLSRYYRTDAKTNKFWDGSYWKKRPDVAAAATPGNSNHGGGPSDQPPSFAVDMVYANPAITWMVANCNTYGLKHFLKVNNEPWHLQPLELPNDRAAIDKNMHLFTVWDLPGQGQDLKQDQGPGQGQDLKPEQGPGQGQDLKQGQGPDEPPDQSADKPVELPPVVKAPPKPSVPVPGGDPEILLKSADASRNRWLQRLLNDCGFADPKLEETGDFGDDSVAAVKRLQQTVGVPDDGRYGQRTANATLAWLST